ncbi:MAG: response regulator transcription factor [Solirubrobacteraceae bacterium]|nr:response regulator transcription factor [Solirubrobacteraceae bacterium]
MPQSHPASPAGSAERSLQARGDEPVAPIEVVVVEDHPPVRQGLELLLPRQGFRMVGSAGSAREGGRMIRARRPAVALVDIDLGDGSGTELCQAIREEGIATAIVLYTGSLDNAVIDAAVASGARGLVLKSSPIEHLAGAIRAAAAGQDYVDRLIAQLPGREPVGRPRNARISKREAQVLGMLSQGSTTEQVAQELFLSPETVQTHVRNAARKLGAHGRLHAVILALIRGDIELPVSVVGTAGR